MASFFKKKEAVEKPTSYSLPWVEKYRPKKLDDICYQTDITNLFRSWLNKDELPHLLFYGPPGSGKSSTILSVCKQLYAPSIYNRRVLELNASDERGINTVREKIKHFAQFSAQTMSKQNENVTGETISYKNPPYKIIILDEADNMTADAQTALRRIIEDFSKVTRFCLVCNHASKIIEPLVSRCALFRFKPIAPSVMKQSLMRVGKLENLKLHTSVYDHITTISNGDLRKGITYLQSIASYFKGDEISNEKSFAVSAQKINELSGDIPIHVVLNILDCNDFDTLRNTLTDTFVCEGYDAFKILQKTTQLIVHEKCYNEKKKCLFLFKIGEAESQLKDSSDEFLVLLNVFSFILKKNKL